MSGPSFDVVIPTVGRPSLQHVLERLARGEGPPPARVVVVDDRPFDRLTELRMPPASFPIVVRRSYGSGPAAARNAGWVDSRAEWVAFLDDDVVPPLRWRGDLAADLIGLDPDVVASQGRVRVPVPGDRRPTDWERNVAGLATARWITADMAVRRDALATVGGFDERFRRAYREDSDLALQLLDRAGRIVTGARTVDHPVAAARWDVSVRKQSGNADDALMGRRYGRSWRRRVGATCTRLRAHVATTACGLLALTALVTRHRRVAAAAGAAWLVRTAAFFTVRARPGPRDTRELTALAVTSVAIPPAAVWHRLRGELGVARDARSGLRPGARVGPDSVPRAVLFDRDGTLVHDVAYNGDPDAVAAVAGAADALAQVRAAGLGVAVVSNQSGIARGILTAQQVAAVNRRVEEMVGKIDHWFLCPHGPASGCQCRKPAPGMIRRAAARFGVSPLQCAVIGDTEADVAAGRASGARAILVPNPATRAVEVARAPETAPSVGAAVDRLLGAGR